MEQGKLKKIIEQNRLYVETEGEEGDRAILVNADMRYADMRNTDMRNTDMRNTDMRNANMRDTDMRNTDMRNANMRDTDMRNADFDFSTFPLWCGSFDIKVDQRLPFQLAYHICRMVSDDPEVQRMQGLLKEFANKSHLIKTHHVNRIE